MASGDGSDWGSSSGCENQGSRTRQGEAVDAGDDDNDGSGLRLARAAVAQGSVCGVRAADAGGGSGYSGGKGDSGLLQQGL